MNTDWKIVKRNLFIGVMITLLVLNSSGFFEIRTVFSQDTKASDQSSGTSKQQEQRDKV